MYTLKQEYEKYTQEDFLVWKLLYQRQKVLLQNMASKEFLKGMDLLQFNDEKIPDFNEVNQILSGCTGWEIVVVPGLIADKDFFELLANKKFPSSTWLRKLENLDYLEEPDMFHDCFAHVPLLTEPFFVKYLQELSKIALKHIDDALAIELIGRIYWFTVEFGLIQQNDQLRIYGAGILSSSGESIFSLGPKANRLPFNVKTTIEKHYYKDKYQDRYYVIQSYEDLFNAIPEIDRLVTNAVNNIPHEKNVNATLLDVDLV